MRIREVVQIFSRRIRQKKSDSSIALKPSAVNSLCSASEVRFEVTAETLEALKEDYALLKERTQMLEDLQRLLLTSSYKHSVWVESPSLRAGEPSMQALLDEIDLRGLILQEQLRQKEKSDKLS